jgi:hypothetical protein
VNLDNCIENVIVSDLYYILFCKTNKGKCHFTKPMVIYGLPVGQRKVKSGYLHSVVLIRAQSQKHNNNKEGTRTTVHEFVISLFSLLS